MKYLLVMFCILGVLSGCHDAGKEAQRRELDSLKFANAKRAIIDSVNAANAEKEVPGASTRSTAASRSKRPLTNPEKGALIGAGAGIVVGSSVSRNPVAGALVGGAIGAGVGAATGSAVDRSKKKKQH